MSIGLCALRYGAAGRQGVCCGSALNSMGDNMVTTKQWAAIVMAGLMLGGIAGCQKKEDATGAGPAEQAGRRLDQVTDKAGADLTKAAHEANQQIQDAARETSQQIDKATDQAAQKVNETTEKAGKKLEQAGEKMQETAREREAERAK